VSSIPSNPERAGSRDSTELAFSKLLGFLLFYAICPRRYNVHSDLHIKIKTGLDEKVVQK
jgi:hypothetical protein